VHGADSTATDSSGSFGYLIVNVGVFEHGVGPILVLLSCQPSIEILLVTEKDFVVSFIHLECAPFGYISNMQVPIIPNNEAHSSLYHPLKAYISYWFKG
jgi:hypothetical protein